MTQAHTQETGMALNSWRHWAGRLAMWLACVAGSPLAFAQQELPSRVARVSLADAGLEWAPAGTGDWQSLSPNWPLTTGDRVRLPAGSRSELHAGAHALRLQGPAQLEISALDEATTRVTLTEGSLNLTVRDLAADERVEIGTGNLAMVVERPGEYRVDADPAGDSTAVAVRNGAATVFGENGESSPLAANTVARYVGRRLTAVTTQRIAPRDGLDQWVAERNRAEDQSLSAQHLSREIIGYQELDSHGEWSTDATYGTVWYPRVVSSDWAPYREGQWRWVDPWGWTWIDDARWGFAPFHYGRWAQIGPRWAWVPGPRARRPAYAPALVGFAGTPLPRPASPGFRHAPGTNWFPLAPGEAWRPPFGAGQRYLDQVNRGMPRPQPGQQPGYRHERRPEAVSTSPLRDLRPDEPVRSTRRERPPGPDFGPAGPGPRFGAVAPEPRFGSPGAGPQFGPPDQALPRRMEQERRERQQREANERQQWRDPNGVDQLQRRHDQNRQEQQQREWAGQQQQRDLQQRQMQQMQQQRDLQERQQQQVQDGHRQHERFMRDQNEARQRAQRDQQDAQQRMQREQQDGQQRMQRDQQAAQQQQLRAQQQQQQQQLQQQQQRQQQTPPPRSAILERQRPPDGIRRSDRERN
jgi:hypothetical protein